MIAKIKKTVLFVGLAFIIIGIFGLSYTYQLDHRSAESLSAYCQIDFQSSHNEKGELEGAVLTLWDWRYDNSKLKPEAVLYTDGSAWEMKAAVKQTPAPQKNSQHKFQNENKLFVELPRSSLPAIKKADSVRFRFYYDNGQTIDLPLNEPDLAYWKRQVE
ncbi:MAG: hypothetical protein SPK53_04400 [Selenomonas sp.]|nr:hypothetical protein [Selenomonadales bacterium]MDD7763549.1 hypothetical protein [Selenomonadales bacterium]MDY5716990.1 hypothetical protein [Selenomonas sp.]